MLLLMFALLVVIERRHPVRAAIYSVGVVMLTYGVFVYALKTPLPTWARVGRSLTRSCHQNLA